MLHTGVCKEPWSCCQCPSVLLLLFFLLLLDSMGAVLLLFFEVREDCDDTHFRYKVDIIPLTCFSFIHQKNPFVKLRSAYQSARALGGQTGSTNTPPAPSAWHKLYGTQLYKHSHTHAFTHTHTQTQFRVESIIAVQGCYPKMLMWRIWPVCSAYILKAFRHHQNIERHACIRLKRCSYHTKPGSSGHFFSSRRQKKKMRGGKREENKWRSTWNIKCIFLYTHTWAHLGTQPLPFFVSLSPTYSIYGHTFLIPVLTLWQGCLWWLLLSLIWSSAYCTFPCRYLDQNTSREKKSEPGGVSRRIMLGMLLSSMHTKVWCETGCVCSPCIFFKKCQLQMAKEDRGQGCYWQC